jgi:hypothetical protein
MGESIPWHGQNFLLKAPAGEEADRVHDLHVFNNGHVTVSCWQLKPEELSDVVQNGGRIYLAVLFGPSQPPVFVGSEDSVRAVVLDYGKVWKKERVE